MFRQVLFAQWKWSREILAFFIVAGFVIPLIVPWLILPRTGVPSARELVAIGQAIGGTTLSLVVLAGLLLALQSHGVDERAGHIYSLTLPVTRTRFLTTRTISAFILLVVPSLAIWLGGALVAGQLEIPPTLRSYAGALALRALLASWLIYAGVTAVRYSAGRRAKAVILALLVAFVVLGVLSATNAPTRSLISGLARFFLVNPGPFGVFVGRWTLIDV
jgi:hypothetical protein